MAATIQTFLTIVLVDVPGLSSCYCSVADAAIMAVETVSLAITMDAEMVAVTGLSGFLSFPASVATTIMDADAAKHLLNALKQAPSGAYFGAWKKRIYKPYPT